MGIQITLNKGRVPVKIWTDDVEHEAIQQLINVSQLPIVHGHIAAMPDVHVGVGATVSPADKNVYKIDLTGATDVSSVTLPASGTTLPPGVTAISKSTQFIDLDANTLAALGNKSPEKWEGLTIGPKLANGGYVILAGTDNDFSVTQNGPGTQFDVYFRMDAVDPFAASIQCPIDLTTGCFFTTGGAAASLTADYTLLPNVLHAYAASAQDLPTLVVPVPLPGSALLFAAGVIGLGFSRRAWR